MRALCLPLLFSFGFLAACGGGTGGGSDPAVTGAPQKLGDPIAGLTAAELAAFQRGRIVFEHRFKPSEGLGPLYNSTSCSSCHSTPTSGGSSKLYRNFYLARRGDPASAGGQFDLPDLPSPVIPAYGPNEPHKTAHFTLQGGRRPIPETSGGLPVQVAQRNAIPIFGVGLFQLVSDTTIIGLSDPDDTDGDGISGRYNRDTSGIGRFGVKAQSNNIEAFTRPPLMNQMGITSDPFLGEDSRVTGQQVSGGSNDTLRDGDGVPDPEISRQDLGDLIAFSTFLAPPQPLAMGAAAQRGEATFGSLGCVKCHVPSLPSSRGPVRAYTDLLIHDMGDDLADHMSFGTPQPSTLDGPTTYREFRTQPLWGVRLHAPFLHDGRAETLQEAIAMHGGEAAAIRDAYLALSATEQEELVAFLESL